MGGGVLAPLRELRWWIVAAVVLAAVVGAAASALGPETARASATARVAVQPALPDRPAVDPADAADAVVGLAAAPAVVDAVAVRAGVEPAVVARGLAVSAGGGGAVTVRAEAPAPEQAERVADTAVAVLGQELARTDAAAMEDVLGPLSTQMQEISNQLRAMPPTDPARGLVSARYSALAAVIAERTASPAPRLVAVGPPSVETVRAGPGPLAIAALSGLGALVVGVLLVLLGARFRPASGTDPAHALVEPVPGGRAFLVWSDDAPAVLTRFWVDVVRDRGPVLVLQLTRADAVDVATQLVAAGRLVGDAVSHRDLTPGAPSPEPISGRALVVSGLRAPDADPVLSEVRAAAPAVVLAVDTAHAQRERTAATVTTLEAMGLEVRGIIVWRGRLPRDPAWTPAAPGAGVSAPA